MKPLTNSKALDEIHFMREWCNSITQYYIDLGDEDEIEWLIEPKTSYSKDEFAGFREAFNDTNMEAIECLSNTQLSELNQRLKTKFGKSLWDFQKKIQSQIRNINKKQKIKNDEEFYFVKSFIDSVSDTPENEQLQHSLAQLIHQYEQNVQ